MARVWSRIRLVLLIQVFVVIGVRAASADTFDVICAGGSDPGQSASDFTSLQAAINAARASSSGGPHTIHVSGNCTEIVLVSGLTDLTIQGTPAVPGTPDDSLTGAVVSSGLSAVLTLTDSSVQVNDMRIVGFAGRNHAVSVQKARAVIRGSVIESAPMNGLTIMDQAAVLLRDSSVVNNGGTGVVVGNLSSLVTGGSVEIAGNGTGGGISASGGSFLGGGGDLRVHHNNGRGINVQYATITMGGLSGAPISVHDNGRQGLFFVSASGDIRNLAVNNNNLLGAQAPPDPSPLPGFFQCGICLNSGSNLFLDTAQITESRPGAHGIVLRAKSAATVRNLTITGNAADGVHIETNSGALFLSSVNNVSGNGGVSANCTDSLSWVGGDTTGIAKPIKCTVVK